MTANPNMNTCSSICRREGVVEAPVHDTIILTGVDANQYFELGSSGKRIWEILGSPTTVGAICDQLAAEFCVERGALDTDVLAFLADLDRENLIRVGG
jgi:coenzyme PQQ synthesis protein D (PqqD)